MSAPPIYSRQVAWFTVHEFVEPLLEQVGSWPTVGSPEWCQLPDDDVRKIAAVYDAARHWALHVDINQQAMADASSEISAAADWSHIAEYVHSEETFYAAHPWLRRKTS